MRLIPMDFSASDASIFKSNRSRPLQFPPSPFAELLLKSREFPDRASRSDDFCIRDWPDDLEMHLFPLVDDPSGGIKPLARYVDPQ